MCTLSACIAFDFKATNGQMDIKQKNDGNAELIWMWVNRFPLSRSSSFGKSMFSFSKLELCEEGSPSFVVLPDVSCCVKDNNYIYIYGNTKRCTFISNCWVVRLCCRWLSLGESGPNFPWEKFPSGQQSLQNCKKTYTNTNMPKMCTLFLYCLN